MQLKCVLKKIDFIPMVKRPHFWISSETLNYGSVLEIDDTIGHQLLAEHPGAFEVVSYGALHQDEKPKKKTKKVDADQLSYGEAVQF